MTITVLKPGVLPETKTFDAKCHHCKCEFTFNPPDAERVSDQRDGDYYRIFCPTCSRECTRSVKP